MVKRFGENIVTKDFKPAANRMPPVLIVLDDFDHYPIHYGKGE